MSNPRPHDLEKILDGITSSMVDSTHALYILQELVIDAGLKQSAAFNEIRAQLKQCWDEAKDLLQECYAVTSIVSLMENERSTAKYEQLMTLMNELVQGCEKCHSKAQILAAQHLIPMERYKEFEPSLRRLAQPTSKKGRNQSHASNEVAENEPMFKAMSTFASAYEILQVKVDDMVAFFTGEVQACNRYLKAAQGQDTGVTLDQARQFAMEWTRVRPIIKAAKANVSRVCDAVTMPPPGVSSSEKGRASDAAHTHDVDQKDQEPGTPVTSSEGRFDISILESSNTTALIGATQRSFDIIVPLSTTRSNHKDVQVILHKIHKGGMNYIALVSESSKTAESGFEFAKRAQDLCDALGGRDYSEELIRDSITEMREIAQKVRNDAKTSIKMFYMNRKEFTEIRTCISETSKSIKTKRTRAIASRDKAKSKASSRPVAKVYYKQLAKGHSRKAISCEKALQSLELTENDLERLRVEMNTFTWIGVDTELQDIEARASALQDDHLLQMRIRGISRDWKEVARDRKTYIKALNTLLNNNPQYKEFVASRLAITQPEHEGHGSEGDNK